MVYNIYLFGNFIGPVSLSDESDTETELLNAVVDIVGVYLETSHYISGIGQKDLGVDITPSVKKLSLAINLTHVISYANNEDSSDGYRFKILEVMAIIRYFDGKEEQFITSTANTISNTVDIITEGKQLAKILDNLSIEDLASKDILEKCAHVEIDNSLNDATEVVLFDKSIGRIGDVNNKKTKDSSPKEKVNILVKEYMKKRIVNFLDAKGYPEDYIKLFTPCGKDGMLIDHGITASTNLENNFRITNILYTLYFRLKKVPYGVSVGIDSNEDYEMAMTKLIAMSTAIKSLYGRARTTERIKKLAEVILKKD